MTFDRFAIAEGWYWWLTHHPSGVRNAGARLIRLERRYKPKAWHSKPTTAEAQAVYDRLCVKMDVCTCQEGTTDEILRRILPQ